MTTQNRTIVVRTKNLPAELKNLVFATGYRPLTVALELATGPATAHTYWRNTAVRVLGTVVASDTMRTMGSDGESNASHTTVASIACAYATPKCGRGTKTTARVIVGNLKAEMVESFAASVERDTTDMEALQVALDMARENECHTVPCRADLVPGWGGYKAEFIRFTGRIGAHTIALDSDADRVLAHWVGYCDRTPTSALETLVAVSQQAVEAAKPEHVAFLEQLGIE